MIPETRPNISFDASGVCDACRRHDERASVDWAARERRFAEIVAAAKVRGRPYDAVIPVSGGKDSTWQVVTCLERGLHVLAVTWRSPARTELGDRNLANLVSLGVDHIDFQIDPRVERRFMLRAFERFGSSGIPMHMALFNIPLGLALKFGAPLVVWGENSALEYGGPQRMAQAWRMDREWLRTYGVTQGTTARDWISPELTARDLTPYFGPSDAELESAGVEALFLGHFFRWDPVATYEVAKAHGFQARPEGAATGIYGFADVDDHFISIHHYLKWFKFGFTRTFDNLSLEIRNGRLMRDQAVEIIRARGDETPHEDIARFCEFTGITRERFFEICERFRHPAVWTRRDGHWVIAGFLVPDRVWA